MNDAIEKTILKARDIRAETIRRYSKTAKTIVVLSVNMPGAMKNTPHGAYLLRQFSKVVCDTFDATLINRHESDAGDYDVFETSWDAKHVKTLCLDIEDQIPLGRFIDLDVHTQGGAFSRAMLGVPERRCFVCDDMARQCARTKKHRLSVLRETLNEHVEAMIASTLESMVTEALRCELELTPKLGLVSLEDSGAHDDMDASHFHASIDALAPFFKAFAEAGFIEPINLESLRNLGMRAEKAMFEATGGVNTHKGAIFCFGAVLPFAARGVLHGESLESIIHLTATQSKTLVEADFESLMQSEAATAGEHIYKTYGFKGVRAEVASGFKSIFAWYPDDNPYRALVNIIARAEDTTVINRHGIGMLRALQQDMRALLEASKFDDNLYAVISDKYKNANVSPGGAADLLALSFFFDRFTKIL